MTERPQRWKRGTIIFVGLITAGNLAFFGLRSADTETSVTLPREIEALIPTNAAVIAPQDTVGADLIDDYTGVLVLDGTEIPLDQTTIVTSLGRVTFRPGTCAPVSGSVNSGAANFAPEQSVPTCDVPARMEPGSHTVTVIYWPQAESRGEAHSFSWEFKVG